MSELECRRFALYAPIFRKGEKTGPQVPRLHDEREVLRDTRTHQSKSRPYAYEHERTFVVMGCCVRTIAYDSRELLTASKASQFAVSIGSPSPYLFDCDGGRTLGDAIVRFKGLNSRNGRFNISG